jgi:3'(2'), 5'-bisphosphate nucleotidase
MFRIDRPWPMSSKTAREAQFALASVREGGLLARQIQQHSSPRAELKADLSPVTVADYAVQALIAARLQQAFPQDRLVGEEGSAGLRRPDQAATLAAVREWLEPLRGPLTGERVCDWIDRGAAEPADRFWTLDPVDGTKGFLRGDQYAVALALIEGGQVVVGALACPQLGPDGAPGDGCAALAIRGGGAWAEPLEGGRRRSLRVSRRRLTERARVLQSLESDHHDPAGMEAVLERLEVTSPALRMDSQAKYLALAAGAADLLLRLASPARPDYREWIWDQAAGSLLVAEAGGMVTDTTGAPLDFSQGRRLANNSGVLASNGLLHAAARRAVQRLRADPAERAT